MAPSLAPTRRLAGLAAAVLLAACLGEARAAAPDRTDGGPDGVPVAARQRLDTAVFAGGCFWCMEPPFDALPGVVSTTSGYSGGRVVDPTYEQVSGGATGHTEVVRVIFDPARVGYARLLDVFWRNVDPLTPNAQFCDQGSQYRSAIFHRGEDQRRQADSSRQALERSGRFRRPVVTEVVPAAPFYPAEAYHQDYYTKNPIRYKFYRGRCGRDARLAELWGERRG
jgi:peptide-methionine (S)-S-oxide reductase